MSQGDRTRLPISNEAPVRRGPSVREKVIQRLHKLAPVAVIAAAPVLNTACDPAPEPYCTQGDPKDWVANVSASAVWADDGKGGLQIELTLDSKDQYAYLSGTYTATGGTVVSTKALDAGYSVVLAPDAGGTTMTVSGELSCDGYPGPFSVKLTWSGTPKAGDKVTAEIAATSM